MHVLILGGTAEARRLAELLHGVPGLELTSSLAGRVAGPRPLPGGTRIGGFGGADGLTAWLREHGVDAVVDATHPFAETMSHHAARAAATARVPLLALRRPGWVPVAGDRWHEVGSLAEAARELPALGRRVFLTTGRLGLAAFADLDDLWFLVRSVDAPQPPHPSRMEILLDRGPFTLDGERELLRRHRVDVVVTKDSGGAATAPKLTAAREAGLPVVVVRRPPAPQGVPVVQTPEDAAHRVREALRGPSSRNR
ncbi:cobalt-precorrin-6A reductase [Streptomyces sp. SID8381]|uniref:cobalt-precorrin-6A reductase n=1 Tax=unclassified Streptomyces TaxID=2593676 RepID=UPI0003646867|nr:MULTISPECIES: cobalt-precorrin-6A reductase [unclassified Streptomyces]MYX25469.1 cobalt-precorrin-6A reductase [Streptomyces sp. SID8381]